MCGGRGQREKFDDMMAVFEMGRWLSKFGIDLAKEKIKGQRKCGNCEYFDDKDGTVWIYECPHSGCGWRASRYG